MAVPSLPPTSPRAVLVVDDDDGHRDVLHQLLAAHGYTVLTAASCREALDRLRRHTDHIGMALIDVLMPVSDGPAVLAALRNERPGLPACFITSYADGYSTTELRSLGADVLHKPLGDHSLVQTVARLLG
jgi:two-component system, cell cycle sensor histidine kinase and response regulator CckA